MANKKINIGMIGFGNIGGAVARNLKRNSAIIAARVGVPVRLKRVADRSSAARARAKAMGIPVGDIGSVINDPDIQIVVEAMGGENPARKIVLAAIVRGKNVVTSNKEVVAKHASEIIGAARKKGVSVSFEAAVGGATPIISPLRDGLSGNDILEVYGIVNGTTNYVLSMMTEWGMEFKDALSEAIRRGYAELNPANDIEGVDSGYKSAILASVAFGADIDFRKIYVEGISHVAQEDIKYALEMGYVVKLLAVLKKGGGRLEVRVHPMLIPSSHQLASVSGNLNAIYVKGSPVGSVLISAAGAGGDPTSSSVIGDVIEIAKRISSGDGPISWRPLSKIGLRSVSDICGRYYIRLKAPDRYGVLAKISKAFADAKVSIQAVYQKETVGNVATIVILVGMVEEKNLMKAMARIKRLPVVKQICSMIRVASA